MGSLMEHADFYRNMLDNTYEAVYFVDNDRRIIFWNKVAESITGFTAQEVVGRHCYNNVLNHVDNSGCKLCQQGCPLKSTVEDGENREAEVFLMHKDGHRVPVGVRSVAIMEDERIIGAAEFFVDSTQKQEDLKMTEQYKALAMMDPLTNIPNRRYIDHFLASKFNEYRTFAIPFGVLFVDIDHFKNVNDTYGHDIGDEILIMLAQSCSGMLRSTDLFGRYGGEEFLAVLTGIDEGNLKRIAESMRMIIENSALRNNDMDLHITISIGLTLANSEDTIESIVKRADTLLYRSKESGRNRVTFG